MPIAGPLKIRVQLLCNADTAMGPGRLTSRRPLSGRDRSRAPGANLACGARRGDRLTDCGRGVLAAFRSLEARLRHAARSAEMQTLSRLVRDKPLVSQREPESAVQRPSK
jgi:hypothetical protein